MEDPLTILIAQGSLTEALAREIRNEIERKNITVEEALKQWLPRRTLCDSPYRRRRVRAQALRYAPHQFASGAPMFHGQSAIRSVLCSWLTPFIVIRHPCPLTTKMSKSRCKLSSR